MDHLFDSNDSYLALNPSFEVQAITGKVFGRLIEQISP